MKVLTNALVLYLILSTPLDMLAQQAAQKETESGAQKAEQPKDAQSAWREVAHQMLGAIIQETDKIEDFGERVRLKARAAGLLWKLNEPQARTQFLQLLTAITQHQPQGKTARETSELQNELRHDVIQEVMRHDRQFAEELANFQAEKAKPTDSEQTDKSRHDPKATIKERTARANRLANLAADTLSQDPERALKLAEESVAEGIVSLPLLNILIPLKMSLGATRTSPLFERVLALLLQEPYITTFELQVLVVYAFPDLQLRTLPNASDAVPALTPPMMQPLFDLALKVFAGTLERIERAPSSSGQRQQLAMHASFLARQLQPKLERFGTVEAVVTLTSLAEQLSKLLSQEQRQMVEANANPQANVANLLSMAEREKDPNRRDAYYAQAAISAYGTGDYHNALKLAERIENREVRQQVQQQTKQLLVQVLADRGDVEAAAQLARELDQPAQRAWGLFWVARAVAKKKDEQPRAIPLLVEAQQQAMKLDDSVEKGQVFLWITDVHLEIGSPRSFEMLSQAVKSINGAFDEKGNPRFLMASVYGQVKPATPSNVRATAVFQFEALFQKLARQDFPRTMGIALEFRRLELRLLAQLAACRAVLVAE
ncbi:MAG: hypothetical protein RMM98_09770 [Acidobacteriota bacterium]|nr:hypothetical protein [Blastocatellia bacterium]MDW8239890.1 hypothetical protein [Acidobacteriota bacterium]